MEKLEAVILIVVVLTGAIGLYYFFSTGAGQATRMLPTCEGDLTGSMYFGSIPDTGQTKFTCRTHGETAEIQLIGIEDGAVYLAVNGEQTGPLGEGAVFLPQNSYCGIKIDEIREREKYVQFCMASTKPECARYEWVSEEKAGGGITGTRECVEWLSSADTKFKLTGQGRFAAQ